MVISQNEPILYLFYDQHFKQHGCNTCRLHSYLLVTVEKENNRILINLFLAPPTGAKANVCLSDEKSLQS